MLLPTQAHFQVIFTPSPASMHKQPDPESTTALRALIHSKRACGRSADALMLARLGVHAAKLEGKNAAGDSVSRAALARYLELMPDDDEARQALLALGPSPAAQRTSARRRLLLLLFAVAGLTAAGSIHLYGLPEIIAPAQAYAPPQPINLPIKIVRKAEDNTPIVIRAVGDVVLGSNYPKQRLPGAADKQRIAALHQELRRADIVLGNLEGVLSDQGKSRKNTALPNLFTFRMPEAYAATLREMGFDVMSLANNHSMDFGEGGLQSTVNALKAQGIQPVGVPGAAIATIKIRNTTVAFLNYSYLPAFARIDDEQRIAAEIKQARAAASLVVVSVHGGKEGTIAIGAPDGDEYFMHEYRGDMLKFAHFAIDSGASAVFGHGPHVVRPYEIYKDKPIFYSLGNFVGYRSLSTKGKLAHSIVAEVRFSPQGQLLGAGIIPLKLDKSGIPAVDYSAASLQTLDALLDEQLEKRPVLPLAMPPVQATSAVASALPPRADARQ